MPSASSRWTLHSAFMEMPAPAMVAIFWLNPSSTTSRHPASRGLKCPLAPSRPTSSLLGTKMVKDAFGVTGNDIRIGAEILVRAAMADEFGTASGEYFDNDSGQFAAHHRDALNSKKLRKLCRLWKRCWQTVGIPAPRSKLPFDEEIAVFVFIADTHNWQTETDAQCQISD